MYRSRRKGSKKFMEAMARGREEAYKRKLLEPAPNYPFDPPEFRRKIIIEDYDFGKTVRHEFLLYRSDRIDCYRVIVDGMELPARMGWAKIMETARKAFVRVTNRYLG